MFRKRTDSRALQRGCVCLITGVSASGKSTVAQLLAETAPRSVHVRGDVFRRMIVGGREALTPGAQQEALEQLDLRYRIGAMVADRYASAGFAVVLQDVVLGPTLATQIERIQARPLYVVVLDPSAAVIAAREAGRTKTAYGEGTYGIDALIDTLHGSTPHVGLWLDTSEQTPEETVEEILDRLKEAEIAADAAL
jgi:adenylylsulfate kinase-like enzyme